MMDDPQSTINDEWTFVTGQDRVTGIAESPTQRDNIVLLVTGSHGDERDTKSPTNHVIY